MVAGAGAAPLRRCAASIADPIAPDGAGRAIVVCVLALSCVPPGDPIDASHRAVIR
jgi:hypothetical protein